MKKSPAAFPGIFTLHIAGYKLGFESRSKNILSVLKGRYGRFIAKGGADCRFDVSETKGRQTPFKPAVSIDGTCLEIKRGDFKASIDVRTKAGTLKAAANEQCLDAFLRSFLSFLLIRSGGFMLHSAGLVKNGKAYIFPGKSGAGKSTLSKLAASAGAEVISDEINLLKFEKGSFRAYGSPFWGEMRADGRPGSWPLGGIYLLGKAKVNKVSAVAGGEALKLQLRCLVNFDKTPGAAERVLKNASSLLAKAKFERFDFSKANADFLNLI